MWLAGCLVLTADESAPARPPVPLLEVAAARDLGFRVGGQLDAAPESAYEILLLALPDCAAEGHDSNLLSLGSVMVHTDARGRAAFSRALDIRLAWISTDRN
jgi:hypothetical protein